MHHSQEQKIKVKYVFVSSFIGNNLVLVFIFINHYFLSPINFALWFSKSSKDKKNYNHKSRRVFLIFLNNFFLKEKTNVAVFIGCHV
jgi:hypothetical protein